MENDFNQNSKVGIFDSGIGGLSVYKEMILRKSPLDVIYFADQAFMPYGDKNSKEIIHRCIEITHFLIEKGCQFIIVACNSATAIAIDELRNQFPEITFIGIEPFIKYVQTYNPHDQNIALLTTNTTSKSERFKKLKYQYDPKGNLTIYPCPNLAEFVEKNFIDLISEQNKAQIINSLKSILSFIPQKTFTHFILGCTHYPLLSSYLKEIFNVELISPESYVTNRFFSLYNSTSNKNSFEFYSSTHSQSKKSKAPPLFPLKKDDPWLLFFSKYQK